MEKHNVIKLVKNKFDLNIWKITNHPPSSDEKSKVKFRMETQNELMHGSCSHYSKCNNNKCAHENYLATRV